MIHNLVVPAEKLFVTWSHVRMTHKVRAFCPQTLAYLLRKTSRIQHCLCLSKECCNLPFNSAVMLRCIRRRKFKVNTHLVLHEQLLCLLVFTRSITSQDLDLDAVTDCQFLHQSQHGIRYMTLCLQKETPHMV